MMRLQFWWARIWTSLWFLPAVITGACVVLAFVLVQADQAHWLPGADHLGWIFSGGAAGARGVLGAIAGSLITVTGVVFSVTIVALQLASSQYSPRVLHNFIHDRPNQVVLGVLIGTFTYTLLVMRTLRSAVEDQTRFVPAVAVTVAIALLLVSVGVLLYFISHAASSIQVETIVERQVSRARHQIGHLLSRDAAAGAEREATTSEYPRTPWAEVVTHRPGYVQAVDAGRLFSLAGEREVVIAIDRAVGEYVLPDEAVGRVWPAEALDDALRSSIYDAVLVGDARTEHQDLEYAILGIADIAVRSLSPGINDPTTALLCVDRLAGLLVDVGRRSWPAEVRSDDSGAVRLLVRRTNFSRLVTLAFDQIRHFGAGVPAVALQLLMVLRRMGPLLQPEDRAILAHVALGVRETAAVTIRVDSDRAAVDRASRDAIDWLGGETAARRAAIVSPWWSGPEGGHGLGGERRSEAVLSPGSTTG